MNSYYETKTKSTVCCNNIQNRYLTTAVNKKLDVSIKLSPQIIANALLKEKERLSQNRVHFKDLLTINDYLA